MDVEGMLLSQSCLCIPPSVVVPQPLPDGGMSAHYPNSGRCTFRPFTRSLSDAFGIQGVSISISPPLSSDVRFPHVGPTVDDPLVVHSTDQIASSRSLLLGQGWAQSTRSTFQHPTIPSPYVSTSLCSYIYPLLVESSSFGKYLIILPSMIY